MMEREEVEAIVELTVHRTVPKAMEHVFEHYGYEEDPRKSQKLQAFLAATYGFFTSLLTRVLTGTTLVALAAAAVWAVRTGKLGG